MSNLASRRRALGVFRNGGYATHLLVPHPRYLFDIGNIPPEQAAPLACSGVTAYGALKKVGPTLKDEPVVIIGAGGVGLMCARACQGDGREGAIVVDIDRGKARGRQEGRRASRRSMAPRPTRRQADLKRTDGGAWAVIDFVGASRDRASSAVDSMIKGGKLIVVGLFGGDITVPTPTCRCARMTIQGSYVGSLHRDGGAARSGEAHRHADRADPHAPARGRQAALNELSAGKVVGRVVLTPD